MAIDSFFSTLASTLSPNSKILRDEKSPDFVKSMERWSNYNLNLPLAIVQPASEEDVVRTVQEALKASIPFVPASGGHSLWSTIGRDGIIVDLSQYTGVAVDAANNLATVKGGTLMKELQTALHPHKQFAAVGNANTVGVIPFHIGGGISTYTPLVGYSCENIVSAKLITAQGELVEVSETQTPELLWGLRGAGQFLGLVTEITIKTYPYSVLGNDQSERMCGTYIFLPQQVDAVCAALQKVMGDKQHALAIHCMIAQAPPVLKQQVLLVTPQAFCSAAEATALFQPLVEAGPIQQRLLPSTFDKHSDHLDFLSVTGDFKRFSQHGMTAWSTENFKRLVELHAELVATCADAARSAYSVQWHSSCRVNSTERNNSSFGNTDVDQWTSLFSWYTDAANHDFVGKMEQKAQICMRAGTDETAFVSYTNTNRDDPLAYRYKGADRLARLGALKKQFDPAGVFTKELL
ncbi:hypothetical protein K438DRAFT_1830907 [Mycena galopus ATCC 62051]|nr:hypothetical protein K438DRAFT_1830907 [Mycena galopus ATCC 62051]